MPPWFAHQHLVPAGPASRALFFVVMSVCLVQGAGLGATRPVLRRAGSCSFYLMSKSTDMGCFHGSSSTSSSTSNSRCQARTWTTALCMASELSKTAISRMRVAELRSELVSRGLAGTGIRPELQARLRQVAVAERTPNVSPRSDQRHRRNSGESVLGSRVVTRTPARPARSLGVMRQSGGMNSSQRQTMGTTPSGSGPSQSSKYVLQFDGGSRGNPGPSGAGAVLYRVDGSGSRVEVWNGSVWVGQRRTNNEAEYSGLIEGLKAAEKLGIKKLAVEGDSKLVIQQMLGKYKVSSPKMVPLFKQAKVISRAFDQLDMEHIERARNGRADTLANIAMDTKASSSFTHPNFPITS
ncbi:unnamed protein product [Scytosiphon promiscuus]